MRLMCTDVIAVQTITVVVLSVNGNKNKQLTTSEMTNGEEKLGEPSLLLLTKSISRIRRAKQNL